MKNTLLSVCVITFVSLGAVFFFRDTTELLPSPATSQTKAPTIALPVEKPDVVWPKTPDAVVDNPAASTSRSTLRTGLAQGVRGILTDQAGAPQDGVQVFLQESSRHDLVARFQGLLQNVVRPPVATAISGSDGAFELGLALAPSSPMELWVLATGFSELRIGDLTVHANAFIDLGKVALENGRTVHGRVEIAGTGLPAQKALVTLEPSDPFQDFGHQNIDPNARRTILCDSVGQYEWQHVPSHGRWRLMAVAPGFARQIRGDIDLKAVGDLVVNFALLGGASIRGRIKDQSGAAVPNALIEVWPNVAEPSFHETPDEDGRFQVLGLRAGPHRMRATAEGFQPADLEQVQVDGPELQIRMMRCGSATLLVRDNVGTLMREFRVAVRLYFPDSEKNRGGQIAEVADIPERSVRLETGTDYAVIDGLLPGTESNPRNYAFQVEAPGFAKSLSQPFTVTSAGYTSVALSMTRGGTVIGRVLDQQGKPISGCALTTQADGAAEDNPIWKMLASSTPDKITRQSATTAADGSFRLTALAHAAYQLVFAHPEYCRTQLTNIQVISDAEQPLPTVILRRGTKITGRTLVDGILRGQIQVTLTQVAQPADPLGKMAEDPLVARVETVSNNDGIFILPQRVPPGIYELRARIQAARNAEEDVFVQMQQMQRSATTVTVPPGRDLIEQDVLIKN
ncbi:MAG: carboxypeptidase regulatory-like domain-containing protein [Planctomycetes bacterium]|nr:carboxypeptidase regulatory-like domain-containing protein [Planctomycetota bacterium]